MAYSRESLNNAICLKLEDIEQATGLHRAMFTTSQIAGVVGVAGAILIAPLAIEVGTIAAVGGAVFYGLSQLVQTKRTGHFLPLPGISVSASQLTHGVSALVSSVMGSAAPAAPEEVRLLPTDWLPQRERRINYLLQHCPDLLIAAGESAQAGISFAAIVDTAVRASEFVISDDQLSNPITGLKLAPEVRKVLTGDTSTLEANQTKAIAQEYQKAQTALAAGELSAEEFAAIESQVRELAPDAIDVVALPAGEDVPSSPVTDSPKDEYRTDWRDVFDLVKDQNLYPAVVVIGAQGLGKTTLVEYLLSVISRREKIVLDPHYQMGAWPGCRVIGAGMDYQAVGKALANISADVKERYLQRATDRNYKPRPVTLILEEQTNWSAKVPGAGQFLKESLSDIRKVGYQTISVAHSDTNTARGGAVGTSKMREQGELKIVLLEQGLAEVSLKGREKFKVRYPDPTHYTVNTGEPVIAAGGDLGGGFIGVDYVDPPSFPAEHSPSQPQPTAATPSQWDLCKSHTTIDGLRDLMQWIEGTTKKQFSPRDAQSNKQLRDKLTDSTTAAIRALMDYLTENDLLSAVGDDLYELSQPD